MNQLRRKQLQANLWKVQLSAFLRNFLVYAPILFVSFQNKGFSLAQIGILMALANISMLFEVPAGVLSDRWSRRHVLALAAVLGAVSMLFWTAETLVLLACGTIFRSLMNACISGTDTALLYDTLKELGREKEYLKHNTHRFSAGMAGFMVATLLASLLASGGFFKVNFLITALALLCSGAVALAMAEPAIHRSIERPIAHLKESFSVATKHPEVRKLVRYGLCISPTIILTFLYIQFFFREAGVDPKYFGFIYTSFAIISFLAARAAHRVEGSLGKRWTLILMPSLLGFGILLLIIGSSAVVVFIGYLAIEILFGIEGSITNSYLQEHLESKYRSTVESIGSLLGGLYNAVMVLVIGFIASAVSIQAAFLFMLIVWLFLIIPPTYLLFKDAGPAYVRSTKSR